MSPVLLECPEQDCSKKYKHANGLRYHQSHAHGSVSSMDEDSSSQAPESPQRLNAPTSPSPGPQLPSTPSSLPMTTSNLSTANASTSQIPTKPPDQTSLTGLAPPSTSAGQIPATILPASVVGIATNTDSTPPPTLPLGSVVGGSIITGVAGQPVQNFVAPSTDPIPNVSRSGEHPLKGKLDFYFYNSSIQTTERLEQNFYKIQCKTTLVW